MFLTSYSLILYFYILPKINMVSEPFEPGWIFSSSENFLPFFYLSLCSPFLLFFSLSLVVSSYSHSHPFSVYCDLVISYLSSSQMFFHSSLLMTEVCGYGCVLIPSLLTLFMAVFSFQPPLFVTSSMGSWLCFHSSFFSPYDFSRKIIFSSLSNFSGDFLWVVYFVCLVFVLLLCLLCVFGFPLQVIHDVRSPLVSSLWGAMYAMEPCASSFAELTLSHQFWCLQSLFWLL